MAFFEFTPAIIEQAIPYVASILSAYYLGRTIQRINEVEKRSYLSTIASIHALVEAESFKKSTVIQRIVEKYNVIPDGGKEESEEVKKLEREMQDSLFSFNSLKATKDTISKPEDLV